MTIKLFFFILIFFTFSNPSFALGKLGHQIVCQLAFEHLSLTKQTQISALLNAIPTKHQHLINNFNYKKKNSPITFANACTWADAIKRLEEFKSYNPWHYMNVPRDHINIRANDCSKNCLPQAILKHQQTLAQTKNDAKWQQVQALLFLGHWLGDIHQPLHISFADDLGGNRVEFSHLATKCKNLHWYWDECILYKGKHSKAKWLALLTEKWHQHLQPNWQTGQVWLWADESFQLAKSASLNYCQSNNDGSCQKLTGKIRLPDNYLNHHQVVMEQRLLLAAQRLTKILEESL
ncbi:S1/P1 nuclease [Candidatus Colwellia aromaticivorans]|uniref:S1/P1 nuclease n=1 Tax=Candidatus Colwellia aromaticivorans TaxID=2267621 RepID=UPI001443EB09|nr:S1/P1 nuclease [Candidatus Colwellia aromaticivorans]